MQAGASPTGVSSHRGVGVAALPLRKTTAKDSCLRSSHGDAVKSVASSGATWQGLCAFHSNWCRRGWCRRSLEYAIRFRCVWIGAEGSAGHSAVSEVQGDSLQVPRTVIYVGISFSFSSDLWSTSHRHAQQCCIAPSPKTLHEAVSASVRCRIE